MLLDDIDKDLLKIHWHGANHYFRTGGGNKRKYAHRIILERKIGRPLEKGEICDHINRNKHDNRRSNLRLANKSINAINIADKPNNSGYRGVYKRHTKESKERGWKPSYWFHIQRKGYKSFSSKYYKSAKEAYNARYEKLKEFTNYT